MENTKSYITECYVDLFYKYYFAYGKVNREDFMDELKWVYGRRTNMSSINYETRDGKPITTYRPTRF